MNGWTNGRTDGQMDEQTEGWTDGWTDKWTGREGERVKNHNSPKPLPFPTAPLPGHHPPHIQSFNHHQKVILSLILLIIIYLTNFFRIHQYRAARKKYVVFDWLISSLRKEIGLIINHEWMKLQGLNKSQFEAFSLI